MHVESAFRRTISMIVRPMEYRAVFKCISGCPGEYDLEQAIYRCPTCCDLLEVVRRTLRSTRRRVETLFDHRYKRTEWPYGSAVWGRKSGVSRRPRRNIVSMDEGDEPRVGRAIGKLLGWTNCGSRCAASPHRFFRIWADGAGVVVRQMIADGKSIRAVACASTGDTSASLTAYAAAAEIHRLSFSRAKGVHARLQPLANGALVLSGHGLRRLHGHRAAYRSEGVIWRIHEQPAARRPKKNGIEIVQPSTGRFPTSSSRRQSGNVSARRLAADGSAWLVSKRPRCGGAGRTEPSLRTRTTGNSIPSRPSRPSRRPSRSGTPSPSRRRFARCRNTTASWSRRRAKTSRSRESFTSNLMDLIWP